MDRRFLAILGALTVLFIGIFIVTSNSSDKKSSTGSSVQASNHVTGEGKKNVTLVEYGDYQCPICAIYYLPVKQVATQFSKDIHFQFRNLPLPQIHPNAFAGARAAEAAGLQGKYWQMHDALYEQNNWQSWTPSKNPQQFFNTYAQQLGLNVNQFKQDYLSTKVNDIINTDVKEFDKTHLPHATPTFFLDGVHVENSQLSDASTGQPSVDKFVNLINAEIAKKTQQ